MVGTKSPLIESSSWGRLEVVGFGTFKDAKLWPGGARAWDWRDTGTHHEPGVQVTDLDELIEGGARVVVLARGRHQSLRVPSSIIETLEAKGVAVHVAETGKAIELYNQLAESNQPVGGLFHTTC